MPNVGYRSSALTDRKLGAKSPSAPGADASSASPQHPSAFSASCLSHRHGDQPRQEWAAELTAGSGPRPHPHLPFCSFSADIILFWDLAFTLKSHHCHQGRNEIIFLLSKCDSWGHFPSCVALFSANPYASVCILLGRKHQTQNGNWSCGSLWVFQGIW